jgi:glycyl-tRNA synthetase beta chain
VSAATLLVELGTEELPPRTLRTLGEAFAAALVRGLDEAGLRADPGAPVHGYATPRRLAAAVGAVGERSPGRVRERRGPALEAAFGPEGAPTPAALGFARSCGVAVEALDRLETPRGTWLVHRATEAGEPLPALLPGILAKAVQALPVERPMRWGDGTAGEFVRPVQWLLVLHGAAPVPVRLLGVEAGNATRGHRFHAPGPHPVPRAEAYAQVLAGAQVQPDVAARREAVRRGVAAAAQAHGGRAEVADALLEEVTALTEWPVPVVGSFDPAFLEVPEEVLIACMQGHQRYFPVRADTGALLPAFVAVANVDSPRPAQVRAGFERVLRARLADARYFWNTDRAQPLAARLPGLAQVVFAAGLGSLADKSARVAALASALGGPLRAPEAEVARAAALAKADLLTAMVGEFPELQGTMGMHYARHDGEPAAVAVALAEQYLPRHAGDALPDTPVGRCLALADRLDTLCGIFATGQVPRGDRDPFGLRRAALGVARILIEGEIAVDLPALLAAHAAGYPGGDGALAQTVFGFILERLPAHFDAQGVPGDAVDAVLARRFGDLHGVARRVRALADFRVRPEAAALAAAHKRIANLLAQAGEAARDVRADPERFVHDAERALDAAVRAAATASAPAVAAGDYVRVCESLAALRAPVDRFFDEVMVLAEDPAVRQNRLALLRELMALFADLGDIGRLQLG